MSDVLEEVKELLVEQDNTMNEDVEAEVRGILEGKIDRLDLMKDLIGKDEFDQTAKKEFMGLLEADIEANDTLTDVLGFEDLGD